MTKSPVNLDDLLVTRGQLIADIQSRFDESTKHFLLSLQDGNPDFSAIDRPQASELPAVRWKLLNLKRLIQDNPRKHAEQKGELEKLLSYSSTD